MLAKENRVRLVFVYVWLARSEYFHQNVGDPKHGFEKFDQGALDNDNGSWWDAVNYIEMR